MAATALALLPRQLHDHADGLVNFADRHEGLAQKLQALGVGGNGTQQRVELDQRSAVLALLEVDLGQRPQRREVVFFVIDEALGHPDVVVGAAVLEQALGGQPEVFDRLGDHAFARIKFSQTQALADRGGFELRDHAKALQAFGDLAGLEVGLRDELVTGHGIADAAHVFVVGRDAGLDVEPVGV